MLRACLQLAAAVTLTHALPQSSTTSRAVQSSLELDVTSALTGLELKRALMDAAHPALVKETGFGNLYISDVVTQVRHGAHRAARTVQSDSRIICCQTTAGTARAAR